MHKYAETLEKYSLLNKTAEKNAPVFFGADWLYDIPVAELMRDSGSDCAVYNRSLKGLMLADAEAVIDTCICELSPSKVFVNLGENDSASNEFAEKFEWLLYTINAKCGCDIYIISTVNDKTGGMNEILKNTAEKYGCEYIDIREYKDSFPKIFSRLRFFLRSHPITFCEAMSL